LIKNIWFSFRFVLTCFRELFGLSLLLISAFRGASIFPHEVEMIVEPFSILIGVLAVVGSLVIEFILILERPFTVIASEPI
jgi:hypothetical protein